MARGKRFLDDDPLTLYNGVDLSPLAPSRAAALGDGLGAYGIYNFGALADQGAAFGVSLLTAARVARAVSAPAPDAPAAYDDIGAFTVGAYDDTGALGFGVARADGPSSARPLVAPAAAPPRPAPTGAPFSGLAIGGAPADPAAAFGVALSGLSSPAAAAPAQSGPGTTASKLSSPQWLDFTSSEVALNGGFSWTLPSFLYHSYSTPPLSATGGGFTVSAYATIAGGIKGGITFAPISILPDFPLYVNPQVLDYVEQSQTFSVKPELLQTKDAGFGVSLPSATASLSFGLTAAAGVSLQFPSVTIGYSFFSHTFDGPKVGTTVSGGNIISLPQSGTEDFTGGSVSINEISDAKTQSTLVSATGTSVPSISETFYTAPFLQANFDALGALSQYVPELKAIDGSESFGVATASWTLLSVPLTASLELADKVTTSEVGLTTHLEETIRGKTTDLKTFGFGHEWDLIAPSYTGSGYGVIALTEDYALTLNVTSVLSLFGSFTESLDGPEGSLSVLGHDFSYGPLFSIPLISYSGDIKQITSKTSQVVLTSTQRELVFYGTNKAAIYLTNNYTTSFDLAASGALLTLAAGHYIAPAVNTPDNTIGVQATLGADAIYNFGNIHAFNNGSPGSIGVDLKAGKLVNTGHIGVGGGYGVLIGGKYSTIVNSGTIGGGFVGIDTAGTDPDSTLFIYNQAGGVIYGGNNNAGAIQSDTLLIDLHNDGLVNDQSAQYGVNAGIDSGAGGLFLYNDATGRISGTIAAVSDKYGFSFIQNEGMIGVNPYGLVSQYGVKVGQADVFNFGTIEGTNVGVVLGSPTLTTSALYNAGRIVSTGGVYAAELEGQSNSLSLKPGASFKGEVAAAGDPSSNSINLLAGSGVGTLSMIAAAYQGFSQIDIAAGASWLLKTDTTGFQGAQVNGLTSDDLLSVYGVKFQYGDSVAFDASSGALTLLDPSANTITSLNLGPGLQGARFNISGTPSATYIREFMGTHFSDVVTRSLYGPLLSLPSQVIDSNSYFGPTSDGGGVTVAQNEGVFYTPAAYPGRTFGLDFQPITVTSTVTSGGVNSVTQVVQPAILYNHGFIEGQTSGLLMEASGTVHNENQIIASGSAGSAGVLATSAAGFVEIINYGTDASAGKAGHIYGYAGVVLKGAGVVQNLSANDSITGRVFGIASSRNSTVVNAGAIAGSLNSGVLLGHDSDVFNREGGVIQGGKYGVRATGTAVAVTNAGSIGGKIGVELAAGGGVTNTYQMVNGAPVWGTISGAVYGVMISGANGEVTNGVGSPSGSVSLASIAGVRLGMGGDIVNSKFGVIKGAGAFSVYLASGATASVANAGVIGALRASGGDGVGNAAGATIQSVTAVAGPAGAAFSFRNAGLIGVGTSGVGVSTAVTTYLYNSGVIDNGVVFAGGVLRDAGAISGRNGGTAIAFGTAASTLIVSKGASFGGAVMGGSLDLLEFVGAGSLSGGVGVSITGFGRSLVQAGAAWTFGGQNTLASNWTIAGQLSDVVNGGLTVTGTTSITGKVTAGAGTSGGAGAPNAIEVASGGRLNTSGQIVGGLGGGNGVFLSGGTVFNKGSIVGGKYGVGTNYGGFGVYLQSGELVNYGSIVGGASKSGAYLPPGGVFIGGGTLITSGTIAGAPGAEAVGFQNSSGSLVVLPGAVFVGVVAGAGGGLQLGAGSGTLSGLGTEFTGFSKVSVNTGGGWTLNGANAVASAITLGANTALTVAGSLAKSGGGAAVFLAGGTLVNAGTLAGASVSFGATASTLALTSKGVFTGTVTAASSGVDTLSLTGAAGTLTGLGTQFTNFGTLSIAAASSWNVTANAAFKGALNVSGALTLTGAQTIDGALGGSAAGQIIIGSGARLVLAGGGSLSQSVSGPGTLEVQKGLTLALGSIKSALLQVDAGVTLSGAGTIASATDDLGMILAAGGGITVSGAVSGAGQLYASTGYTVTLSGGGAFGGGFGGGGVVHVASAFTLASGATIGVQDLVASANLTLAAGESVSIGAGHLFDILTAPAGTVTLAGASGDTFTNAGTLRARGGGVATVGVGVSNSGEILETGGTLVLQGALTNTGTLVDSVGNVTVQQAVSGVGAITVAAGATLTLGGAVAAGQTLDMTHGGLLDLGNSSGFLGTIADFRGSAGIDLLSAPVNSESFAANTLTLKYGANVVGRLHFAGSYTLADFTFGSDGAGGTKILSHV